MRGQTGHHPVAFIAMQAEEKKYLPAIRFSEEYKAWKVGPSISIPLNELPARLDEIDKTKIVVTALRPFPLAEPVIRFLKR